MGDFHPFVMERWQSTWEHRVRHNLSESGVHPLSTRELLELAGAEGADLEAGLLDLRQGYGQSNGSEELRARIAALYPGGDPAAVLVTVGGAEANFVALWRLLHEGDEWAAIVPTYMQVPGLVRNFGGTLHPVHLREEEGWQPDPDEVEAAFRAGARVLLVTNPNNPSGAVLDPDRMEAISAHAANHDAWIVADEVYAGAEVSGPETPSFYGRHSRVVCTHSLSKAYGLPGLRVGWTISTPELAEELWSRTDYTTITPATLSDALATLALSPAVRPKILERTRGIIRANRDILARWVRMQDDRFSYRPPDAGAIAFLRYRTPVNSSELAERLRVEKDLLVVPGDQFGMDGYVRIGFGPPEAELAAALDRVRDLFDELEA
jgi:aspartate/methionine/tyrosine aminotransferase